MSGWATSRPWVPRRVYGRPPTRHRDSHGSAVGPWRARSGCPDGNNPQTGHDIGEEIVDEIVLMEPDSDD